MIKAKQLLFDAEARTRIMSGVEQLSRAVKITLGPKGCNVVLDRFGSSPLITKDGVSVAKEVFLEDPFENMGAQMVKEVAEKTAEIAGDGTTTATLLAEFIYREGLKNVTAGADPMSLKRGIDKATAEVVKCLESMAQPIHVDNLKELGQVATLASNSDTSIGDTIAEAFHKVGKEGVITVEENDTMVTELKTVDGMQIDQGYLSLFFSTDSEKLTCDFQNPLVFLSDKKLSSVPELIPLLETVAKTNKGRPLVIISDDFEGHIVQLLVVNKLKGILPCVAIKAPGFGTNKKEVLADIAALTGGILFSDDLGTELKTLTVADLGSAKRITVTKDKTTIIGGNSKPEQLAERIAQIKFTVDMAENDYDKNKAKERLAKLSNGVAVIRLGATTQTEMKEKKDRVEDALHATRAAVEEGIVPGGGIALLKCLIDTYETKHITFYSEEEKIGAGIIFKSLEAPIRQLATNAGLEGSVIIDSIKRAKETSQLPADNLGYDFMTNEIKDMLIAGIIDPVKVTRTALQNAASIAGLLLTTKCLITDAPEKEKLVLAPMGPGGANMGGLM